MQLLFLCYQPNCHMGFTFATTRCSLWLTQHILTFCTRRSSRMSNFTVREYRSANDFFCKIATFGSLIHQWYCWKMFAVHFYTSCFDSRGNLIGKKSLWLDYEKAVYWPLFVLANTMVYYAENRKYFSGLSLTQNQREALCLT